MQDEKIIDLFWERDEAAIREAQKNHYLKTVAYHILWNEEDAEETVNDAYFKAWRAIPPYRPIVLSAYLCKLTRQGAIDLYRAQTAKKRGGGEYTLTLDELKDCISEGNVTEENFSVRQLGETMEKWLQSLSKKDRVIFLGRYFYADSEEQIATYAGGTAASVKSRLFRLRKKLQMYLKKEGYMS